MFNFTDNTEKREFAISLVEANPDKQLSWYVAQFLKKYNHDGGLLWDDATDLFDVLEEFNIL